MDGKPRRTDEGDVAPPVDVSEGQSRLARHEEPVSPDLLTASFPIAMRGYNREAVDSHIEQLNRVIAELEMNRSPRSAVRHALDRVGEQTAGILRQAREAAEDILASAREEADEITDRATAEARELVVDASDDADRTRADAEAYSRSVRDEADVQLAAARDEAERIVARAQAEADQLRSQLVEELEARRGEGEAKMRELRADTDAVWNERHDLLAEIRQFADQAKALATDAAERLPGEDDPPGGGGAESIPDTKAGAHRVTAERGDDDTTDSLE